MSSVFSRAGQGTTGPAMPRYLCAADQVMFTDHWPAAHLRREHMNLDATVSGCPAQQLRRLIRPTSKRRHQHSVGLLDHRPEFQQVLPAAFIRPLAEVAANHVDWHDVATM